MRSVSHRLSFLADPAAFLAVAGGYLEADPVLCSVVASIAQREAATGQESAPGSPHWYLSIHTTSDTVVGVAMRTAPHPPHPLFVLPMPDPAATELARTLHRRGEPVGGVNGALPAAAIVAEETARLAGVTVELAMPTRLYELRRLVPPTPVPGALRAATPGDVDLVLDWLDRFHRDADLQAGREPSPQPPFDPRLVASRVEAGRYWLWWHGSRPVHLSGVNAVSFGAQRIGPVYTPPEDRGRGWAAAAVAELCRRALSAGARPCLFTDQTNPVSNHLYTALGFEPVVDMANLTISR